MARGSQNGVSNNPSGRSKVQADASDRVMNALCNAMDDEEAQKLAVKLVSMATGGDLAAMQLVLNRICGMPNQPNTVDGHMVHHIEEVVIHVRDGESTARIFAKN